jgi:phosphoadenosine phosphosulfate reductase
MTDFPPATPQTLDSKITASLDMLRAAAREHPFQTVRVAWTGGKDSTVVLHLWLRVCDEMYQDRPPNTRALALGIDTGCKFQETLEFRKRMQAEWNVTCHVVSSAPGPDYPIAHNKPNCCLDLKIRPLKNAIRETQTDLLLVGLRRDEHPSRSGLPRKELYDEPPHTRGYPLLDWTEMDIWAYITDVRLPYCSLYDQGYRSLGCKPCTAAPFEAQSGDGSERAGRALDKERHLEQLHSLGYF